MIEEPVQLNSSPYSIFILAIRSPITREKYLQRLGYFFDYIGIGEQGTIEDRCNIFGEKAKSDINWFANNILKYLQIHKNRVERKEITGSTLRNYIRPIILFCEQMDIDIPWNKITRGMPKGRKYANDRAPTIEEIKRMLTSFKSCLPNSNLCSIGLSIIRYGNAFEFTCSKIIV